MSTAAGSSTGASVVYVTVPSMEVAESIAGMLVDPEQRLAACVNIVPGVVPRCALGGRGTWIHVYQPWRLDQCEPHSFIRWLYAAHLCFAFLPLTGTVFLSLHAWLMCVSHDPTTCPINRCHVGLPVGRQGAEGPGAAADH